eukprot:1133846-Rhodomonas_salina.1
MLCCSHVEAMTQALCEGVGGVEAIRSGSSSAGELEYWCSWDEAACSVDVPKLLSDVCEVGLENLCVPVCGDSWVVEGSEECDDGNTDDGDGCSATCRAEAGYSCQRYPWPDQTSINVGSSCEAVAAECGDGQWQVSKARLPHAPCMSASHTPARSTALREQAAGFGLEG